MGRKYSWTYVLTGSVTLLALVIIGHGRLGGQPAETADGLAANSTPYIFQLELDGAVVAEYTECWGLGSSNEVQQTVAETPGGMAVQRKTPGPLRWHNITLKRTGPSGVRVWSWRKAMVDGYLDAAFEDGAIVMTVLGAPEPIARWQFEDGWVAQLTIEGVTEQLIIVHEGLERVDPIDGPPTGRRR